MQSEYIQSPGYMFMGVSAESCNLNAHLLLHSYLCNRFCLRICHEPYKAKIYQDYK